MIDRTAVAVQSEWPFADWSPTCRAACSSCFCRESTGI